MKADYYLRSLCRKDLSFLYDVVLDYYMFRLAGGLAGGLPAARLVTGTCHSDVKKTFFTDV